MAKPTKDAHISPATRLSLYQAPYLSADFKEECGLLLPFVTYFQDPFVAQTDPQKGLDEKVLVAWEPGLADGPTSSRFAVVDYNADTGTVERPATWDASAETFVDKDGKRLDGTDPGSLQFHQVSVWALVQRTLAFFEDASALGRTIPWAFEGNRLIVVPHAGYGQNAYYDRSSKSLQFYYFNSEAGEPVQTCLSVDIVHHELAHAVLDGVRPLLNESSDPQTAGFHEFMGDLTAILMTLRNGRLRQQLAVASNGEIDKATTLSSLAEEFGKAAFDRPYLRTALNKDKMSELAGETEPHRLSEVLTGTMFEILIALGKRYKKDELKEKTNKEVFWFAADRMQRTAIQPLDLLPPVEVTFRDYALAVCRSQQLSDPLDPKGYYDLLIDVFRKREILSAADEKMLKAPRYLTERLALSVPPIIDDISRSRASAYKFLDDNRKDLLIPANRDFFVADLYDARKRGRQNLPLPRQIVLQYAWREEVPLDGPRFGKYAGRTTTMLCGGTLVFNDNGNVLSWMRKPGSLSYDGKPGKASRKTKRTEAWEAAIKEGTARRAAFLDQIAAQVAAGRIGPLLASAKGLVGTRVPPMTAEEDGELVRFRLSPHLHLFGDAQLAQEEETGERQWEISC